MHWTTAGVGDCQHCARVTLSDFFIALEMNFRDLVTAEVPGNSAPVQ